MEVPEGSCTGKAPGFLTLPTTYTLPTSGTRISSPPSRTTLAAGSAVSIRDFRSGRILHGEGTRVLDVADDVHLADLGNANLFAAFQDDVGGRIGGLDQGFPIWKDPARGRHQGS